MLYLTDRGIVVAVSSFFAKAVLSPVSYLYQFVVQLMIYYNHFFDYWLIIFVVWLKNPCSKEQIPFIVRCIYGKYPLNPPKIATKGFSTDSVRV